MTSRNGGQVVAPRPEPSDGKPTGKKSPTGPEAVRSDDWFEDVTAQSGIHFVNRNGREGGRYYLIESFGGGVAMIDYDLDGSTDLFFTGGGTISTEPEPPRISGLASGLFRNEGDWRFVDVSVAGGFADPADYSFGCSVTDFDNDGFSDLFVTCYGRSRLYRNQGDGTFAEGASAEQLPAIGMCTAAAWADVDRDGLPDLLLARYVDWSPEIDIKCVSKLGLRDLCGPGSYEATTARFFHNRGDGGFDDWSESVGLHGEVKGLGVLAADFDNDGWIDFYLANDEVANHLYWGGPERKFEESGWRSGVAAGELGLEEGSMGVDVGDVNNDGLPDLWVVNYVGEDNSLYLQRGERLFEHATTRMGLASATRQRVAWGTSITDFDGDGWSDVVVLNGHAVYYNDAAPFEQSPQLFRNRQGRRFETVSEKGGVYFRQVHASRGAAVGDLDGDGAPDLVAVHVNAPATLLRNRQPPPNFVSARIRATGGAIDAVGARIQLLEGTGNASLRFAVNGAGYASHSDDQFLFPLSADVESADIVVHWPGRATERFRRVALKQTNMLVEGRGEPHERK